MQYMLPHKFEIPGYVYKAVNTSEIQDPVYFWICILAKAIKAKSFLELGTAEGNGTRLLIELAKETGGHVWTTDILPHNDKTRNFKLSEEERKWCTAYEEDSLILDWDSEIDILFVDSSHELEPTINELDRYWKFITPNGYLVFHDFSVNHTARIALIYWAQENGITFLSELYGQGTAIVSKESNQHVKIT